MVLEIIEEIDGETGLQVLLFRLYRFFQTVLYTLKILSGARILNEKILFVAISDRRYGREGRGRPVWLEKYGPPTRTENRLIIENLSSRVSWQDLKDYMRQVNHLIKMLKKNFQEMERDMHFLSGVKKLLIILELYLQEQVFVIRLI